MAIGNWVADILLHAYAEMLEETSSKGREKGDNESGKPNANGKMDGKPQIGGGDADGRADAVIICGGTLRGDSVYPPGESPLSKHTCEESLTSESCPDAGKITLGDILEIMPFDDPVVCLEVCFKGDAVRYFANVYFDC